MRTMPTTPFQTVAQQHICTSGHKSTNRLFIHFYIEHNQLTIQQYTVLLAISYPWSTSRVTPANLAGVLREDYIGVNSALRESRFSRILKIFFEISLLDLDLESFLFHFHFSISISSHFHFTFISRKE